MGKALGVMPTYIRTATELAVTAKAIQSWCGTTDQNLVVVDDCSPNEELLAKLVDFVEPFPQVDLVMRTRNDGFAATVNVGLGMALESGVDAVLVNSDIEFLHKQWLENMQANDAWVVGALLLFPNKLIQHAGIYFSVISRSFNHIFKYAPGNLPAAQERRVCPVTGALQLVRIEALRDIGLYDVGFRMGWEDVAYCTDVFVAKERCVYEPTAIAIHHESLFRGRNKNKKISDWEAKSWEYLHRKYAGLDFSEWCPTLIEDGCWQ